MARTPFKLKSGNSTPFKQMGSSPVKQVELGPASKRIIKKGKKVVKKVSEKVSDFIKGFSSEEIKKRNEEKFRAYVKKSNIDPKKYPPKSSDDPQGWRE